jgi:hypothetical protein
MATSTSATHPHRQPVQDRFEADAKGWAGYAVGIPPVSMGRCCTYRRRRTPGQRHFEDDATEFAYGAGARLRLAISA